MGRNAVDTLTRGTKDEYLGWLGGKLSIFLLGLFQNMIFLAFL